ncbi:MAG: surface lipoprotein assembly modifier [Planctomycetota bacterium]|nr:surface lipoprotein assembly modifier [Planctomycetota bacterium]
MKRHRMFVACLLAGAASLAGIFGTFGCIADAGEAGAGEEIEREAVASVEESLVEAEAEEGDIFKEAERRWRLNFSYTCRWDDNVTLEPDRMHVKDNEADWVHIFTFGANARLVEEQGHILAVGYSLYQNFYDRHDELSLHGSTGSVIYTYKHAPVVAIVPFSYSYFLLDGYRYLHFPQFQPTILWQQTERLVGMFQGTYRALNYVRNRPVNGFVDENRSADQYTLGYEQWILIQPEKNHRIQVGLDGIYETTKDPAWSYRGLRAHAEYKVTLPLDLLAELGFAWEPRVYMHHNPLYVHSGSGIPIRQRDHRFSYNVVLGRPFNLGKFKLTVAVNYRYIDNQSNAEPEDYSKHYVGLTIGGSF